VGKSYSYYHTKGGTKANKKEKQQILRCKLSKIKAKKIIRRGGCDYDMIYPESIQRRIHVNLDT